MHIGILTGILRVAREGIFSGLNNLRVYDIFQDEFSSFFGLEEIEVEAALKYYEMEYKIKDVKKWYDGYRFGNSDVYNPWSILNYLENKKLESYWLGTSDNALIYDMLEKSDLDTFKDFEKLVEGKELEKVLDSSFNFNDFKKYSEGIWQLMVYGGYLRIKRKISQFEYIIDIPNYEIRTFFEKDFVKRFLKDTITFNKSILALLEGKIEKFEYELIQILKTSTSYFDFGQEEKLYHILFLGMLISLKNNYKVKSNLETGYGRTDILLIPFEKNKVGFVFEFKVAKAEDELEEKAKEALKQINEKEYDIYLKEEGIKNIYKIGMSFCGKKLKIEYEKKE